VNQVQCVQTVTQRISIGICILRSAICQREAAALSDGRKSVKARHLQLKSGHIVTGIHPSRTEKTRRSMLVV